MENTEKTIVEQDVVQDDKKKEMKSFNIEDFKDNDDFQKYLQSFADKRVTSAIQKKEQEYNERLENERKQATMTNEELAEQKKQELEEREKQLQQYELKLKKIDYFKENNLDIGLVDYVSAESEEDIVEKSQNLINIINNLVEKQVKERLKDNGYTPRSNDVEKVLSMEDLANMKPEDINKYWGQLNK